MQRWARRSSKNIKLDRFDFFPNGSQARALNRRMRLSLADSLQHIAEESAGKLAFNFSALEPLISNMRSGGRYPCSSFAIYAEIVLAICNGEHDRAVNLLEELVLEKPLAQPWRVLAIDDAVHEKNMDRLLRSMNHDPNTKFFMGPPSADLVDRFSQRVMEGYSLLATVVPELAEEFEELVSDVILVVGDDNANYQFDGGSSYLLWGGLFLNATSHKNEVAMAEVMAHESAHILLYACAADEALVKNPDEELFPSPLRIDLRPMDGIYHATFVSARMHWAMAQLISSGRLSDTALDTAKAACMEDLKNFWAGHEVVARHGQLTRTGYEVMQGALSYMESVR